MSYRVEQLTDGDWAILNSDGDIMARYSIQETAQADLERYASQYIAEQEFKAKHPGYRESPVAWKPGFGLTWGVDK